MISRYKGGKLVEYKTPGEEDFAPKRRVTNKDTAYLRGKAVRPIPTEHEEQAALVDYIRKCRPGLKFFSVPNGARTRPSTANRLKAEGMAAGVPDLVFPMPRGKFHGLYLEMKRSKGGRVDVDQQIWIDFLRGQGYKCEVAEGCDAARTILDYYMSLGKFQHP